ncbi:MAG: DUF4279 domain-containing protein [Cyanobacteria bacterium HKST-UBA02]|nr:DUF4279 domain-containing protein [Cyanobacteria bacterium HKST-UBA02]
MKKNRALDHIYPKDLELSLIFCHSDVDPDLISAELGIIPTSTLKKGEFEADISRESYVGRWELKATTDSSLTIEEQIQEFVFHLASRKDSLKRLSSLGYRPYLSVCVLIFDQGVYLGPALLQNISSLSLGVSIWTKG